MIPKDASTEIVTASPSNILVADKSRGFNQAQVTATGYVRPLQDGGAVKKSVAAEAYTKQVKDVVASTSNTVDASGLAAAKNTIATEATSKAKAAIEAQGMRADGIEISEITIETDIVDKVEEKSKDASEAVDNKVFKVFSNR